MNQIKKDFRAWLTFEPTLTNKDIQSYDFSKLNLSEMKIKYIESLKQYTKTSKKELKQIIEELNNIKDWSD